MVASPGLHDLGRRPAVGAPQHRLHPRDQLGGRERLREVVVAAELEAEHAVDLAVARGEEDHRDLRRLADALAHLEPVDVGEPDVEHHEPGPLVADRLEPGLAGRGLQHPVALAGEVEVDEVGDVRLVVDDEDRSPFHAPHRRTSRTPRQREAPCQRTVKSPSS